MIDRKFVGLQGPPRSIEVEKYPIRFFAEAIGEENPIHSDEAAAKRAAYRSVVAPLTYANCLNAMSADAHSSLFREMSVPMARILHGEQHFIYHAPIVAGDVLTLRSRIADIYDKKDGALEFIVMETSVTNQKGERTIEMRSVAVVRN